MRIKSIHLDTFKRFTNLTITGLPESARLVVLTGPNGSGKSSLFDAFRVWHGYRGAVNWTNDQLYYLKQGLPYVDCLQKLRVEFFTPWPSAPESQRKAFYIRSAYRNQPDFEVHSLSRMDSVLQSAPVMKLIDNDVLVQQNYERLVSSTIERVYRSENEMMTVKELRGQLIGEVRDSMRRVFADLFLTGPGNPLENGAFYFDKGTSSGFHYKNLSGGEKAAFDILLDIVVKRLTFDDTVFCIDEPEAHMHTRLQACLLEELVSLLPAKCQLWIATHSIGMLRKARDMQRARPNDVVFLDLGDRDFDSVTTISPTRADRRVWENALRIALDDLSTLVAPRQIVFCEGRAATEEARGKLEFDAQCYRSIFGDEYPDTEFLSVGNASDVVNDRLAIQFALEKVIRGMTLIRLIDRDDRSTREIEDAEAEGIRVLSLRNLESCLLDDEILTALCVSVGQGDKAAELAAEKEIAIGKSVDRGNPRDDLKSAKGEIYLAAKRILQLTQCGNTADAFLRDTLAPLVTTKTNIYAQLKRDIFQE